MGARKFKKLPVVIEAMQWDGTALGATGVIEWAFSNREYGINYSCNPGPNEGCTGRTHEHFISIETLEGTITASRGDWIIKGVNGEFYPCKPDIFEKTYIEVYA